MSTSRLCDFTQIALLGRGSYGTVHSARRRQDNGIYVLKLVPLSGLSAEEQQRCVQEVRLMAGVSSPYIVKYYDSFIDGEGNWSNKHKCSYCDYDTNPPATQQQAKDRCSLQGVLSLCIVMEYCDSGDLNGVLEKCRQQRAKELQKGQNQDKRAFSNATNPEKPSKKEITGLDEAQVWIFFIHCALGLWQLHQQRILHRDIKPANVFMHQGQAKLGDLGVARSVNTAGFASTLIGTPYYLAPELVQGRPYSYKADVWSLGVLLYELLTLRHPFEAGNQAALLLKIMDGRFKAPDSSYSGPLRALVKLLLRKSPTQRPSVAQILTLQVVRRKASEFGISLPEIDQKEGMMRDHGVRLERDGARKKDDDGDGGNDPSNNNNTNGGGAANGGGAGGGRGSVGMDAAMGVVGTGFSVVGNSVGLGVRGESKGAGAGAAVGGHGNGNGNGNAGNGNDGMYRADGDVLVCQPAAGIKRPGKNEIGKNKINGREKDELMIGNPKKEIEEGKVGKPRRSRPHSGISNNIPKSQNPSDVRMISGKNDLYIHAFPEADATHIAPHDATPGVDLVQAKAGSARDRAGAGELKDADGKGSGDGGGDVPVFAHALSKEWLLYAHEEEEEEEDEDDEVPERGRGGGKYVDNRDKHRDDNRDDGALSLARPLSASLVHSYAGAAQTIITHGNDGGSAGGAGAGGVEAYQRYRQKHRPDADPIPQIDEEGAGHAHGGSGVVSGWTGTRAEAEEEGAYVDSSYGSYVSSLPPSYSDASDAGAHRHTHAHAPRRNQPYSHTYLEEEEEKRYEGDREEDEEEAHAMDDDATDGNAANAEADASQRSPFGYDYGRAVQTMARGKRVTKYTPTHAHTLQPLASDAQPLHGGARDRSAGEGDTCDADGAGNGNGNGNDDAGYSYMASVHPRHYGTYREQSRHSTVNPLPRADVDARIGIDDDYDLFFGDNPDVDALDDKYYDHDDTLDDNNDNCDGGVGANDDKCDAEEEKDGKRGSRETSNVNAPGKRSKESVASVNPVRGKAHLASKPGKKKIPDNPVESCATIPAQYRPRILNMGHKLPEDHMFARKNGKNDDFPENDEFPDSPSSDRSHHENGDRDSRDRRGNRAGRIIRGRAPIGVCGSVFLSPREDPSPPNAVADAVAERRDGIRAPRVRRSDNDSSHSGAPGKGNKTGPSNGHGGDDGSDYEAEENAEAAAERMRLDAMRDAKEAVMSALRVVNRVQPRVGVGRLRRKGQAAGVCEGAVGASVGRVADAEDTEGDRRQWRQRQEQRQGRGRGAGAGDGGADYRDIDTHNDGGNGVDAFSLDVAGIGKRRPGMQNQDGAPRSRTPEVGSGPVSRKKNGVYPDKDDNDVKSPSNNGFDLVIGSGSGKVSSENHVNSGKSERSSRALRFVRAAAARATANAAVVDLGVGGVGMGIGGNSRNIGKIPDGDISGRVREDAGEMVSVSVSRRTTGHTAAPTREDEDHLGFDAGALGFGKMEISGAGISGNGSGIPGRLSLPPLVAPARKRISRKSLEKPDTVHIPDVSLDVAGKMMGPQTGISSQSTKSGNSDKYDPGKPRESGKGVVFRGPAQRNVRNRTPVPISVDDNPAPAISGGKLGLQSRPNLHPESQSRKTRKNGFSAEDVELSGPNRHGVRVNARCDVALALGLQGRDPSEEQIDEHLCDMPEGEEERGDADDSDNGDGIEAEEDDEVAGYGRGYAGADDGNVDAGVGSARVCVFATGDFTDVFIPPPDDNSDDSDDNNDNNDNRYNGESKICVNKPNDAYNEGTGSKNNPSRHSGKAYPLESAKFGKNNTPVFRTATDRLAAGSTSHKRLTMTNVVLGKSILAADKIPNDKIPGSEAPPACVPSPALYPAPHYPAPSHPALYPGNLMSVDDADVDEDIDALLNEGYDLDEADGEDEEEAEGLEPGGRRLSARANGVVVAVAARGVSLAADGSVRLPRTHTSGGGACSPHAHAHAHSQPHRPGTNTNTNINVNSRNAAYSNDTRSPHLHHAGYASGGVSGANVGMDSDRSGLYGIGLGLGLGLGLGAGAGDSYEMYGYLNTLQRNQLLAANGTNDTTNPATIADGDSSKVTDNTIARGSDNNTGAAAPNHDTAPAPAGVSVRLSPASSSAHPSSASYSLSPSSSAAAIVPSPLSAHVVVSRVPSLNPYQRAASTSAHPLPHTPLHAPSSPSPVTSHSHSHSHMYSASHQSPPSHHPLSRHVPTQRALVPVPANASASLAATPTRHFVQTPREPSLEGISPSTRTPSRRAHTHHAPSRNASMRASSCVPSMPSGPPTHTATHISTASYPSGTAYGAAAVGHGNVPASVGTNVGTLSRASSLRSGGTYVLRTGTGASTRASVGPGMGIGMGTGTIIGTAMGPYSACDDNPATSTRFTTRTSTTPTMSLADVSVDADLSGTGSYYPSRPRDTHPGTISTPISTKSGQRYPSSTSTSTPGPSTGMSIGQRATAHTSARANVSTRTGAPASTHTASVAAGTAGAGTGADSDSGGVPAVIGRLVEVLYAADTDNDNNTTTYGNATTSTGTSGSTRSIPGQQHSRGKALPRKLSQKWRQDAQALLHEYERKSSLCDAALRQHVDAVCRAEANDKFGVRKARGKILMFARPSQTPSTASPVGNTDESVASVHFSRTNNGIGVDSVDVDPEFGRRKHTSGNPNFSAECSATFSPETTVPTPTAGGSADDAGVGVNVRGSASNTTTTASPYAPGHPCTKTSYVAAETAAQYADEDVVGAAYWCVHLAEEAKRLLRRLEGGEKC